MVSTNWEPYYSEYLPGGGPVPEVTREAFAKMGYEVEISWIPWARAQRDVENGTYMGLLGPYKTAQRQEYAVYSAKPLATALTGIFGVDGTDLEAASLEEMMPYSIGVLRGSAVSKEFDESNLSKHLTNTEGSAIRMLLSKRVDAIAGDYYVFSTLLRKINPERTLETIMILSREGIYNAFSKKVKNHKQLKDDFDQGFKLIKADGTYAAILKKHGILEATNDSAVSKQKSTE
jgi:polar amino acid transport system substrate-binding protein